MVAMLVFLLDIFPLVIKVNNGFKIAYLRVTCTKKATITLPITFTNAATCITHKGGGNNSKATYEGMVWATDDYATSTIQILNCAGPYTACMITIGY